jgi:purine-cytosine permease-like protein
MANENNLTTPDGANEALTSLNESGRVFLWHDHLSLWFSLGVGLLVMQVGAFLVPAVGTRDAAVAIVLGSIIGAALLAWTARVGCQSGIAIYHACAAWAPQWGSALPTLVVTFVLAWLTRAASAGGSSALAQSRG